MLEQQPWRTHPLSDRAAREQRGVAFGIGEDRVRRGREHDLAEAPHARRMRTGAGAPPPLVEQAPQRGPTHARRSMADLEQPSALGTAGTRVELGDLVSAGGAALAGVAHPPASFRTSFRIPPAVTAGPAPGPATLDLHETRRFRMARPSLNRPPAGQPKFGSSLHFTKGQRWIR